jgi:outer membrane immunogenic protein
MKKLKAAISLLLLSSAPVLAADLPSIKSEPVISPAPIWSGFYAGLNAGGAWNNSNNVNVYTWPTKPLFGYFTTSAPLNGGISSGSSLGFIGGGQFGYNLQSTLVGFNFVAGLEADFQGLANSKNTR